MRRSARGGRRRARHPLLAAHVAAASLVAGSALAGPPAPRVTHEAGLAISRAAADDRRLGSFKARSDGGYDYLDPQRRFRARISEDGRVTFRNTSPIRELGVCTDRQTCAPVRGILGFLRDPSRWRQEPSANDYGAALHGTAGSPSTAHLSIAPSPGGGLPSPLIFGVGGRFGPSLLSDRVKADFLRDTFELRLSLARKAERRRLVAALSGIQESLERIWRDPTTPLERRRELLFERWDECLDALPPNRDPSLTDDLVAPMEELRHRAAEEARRQILRFIRDRAPQGSDAAFTAAELRRLNARRRSVETFAPYASP
ncbi:MAG: hypothetical protein R3A79_28235 [Nannocystaceae bacterium]